MSMQSVMQANDFLSVRLFGSTRSISCQPFGLVCSIREFCFPLVPLEYVSEYLGDDLRGLDGGPNPKFARRGVS
jgi:hypothetical protein